MKVEIDSEELKLLCRAVTLNARLDVESTNGRRGLRCVHCNAFVNRFSNRKIRHTSECPVRLAKLVLTQLAQ